MKVLFLVSNMMSGGVERTVSYISSFFANNGIETHILSLSDEIFYNIDSKVIVSSLGISRKKENFLKRLQKIKKRYIGVKRYLKKYSFDVVFCMSPEMIRYLFFIRKKDYGCLITSERNNPLFDTKKEKRIKKRAFKKCDGVIFQTKRAMECFDKSVQEKGIVIPNAVGNDLVYSLSRDGLIVKNKFSAVGRLAKQKDYKTMLYAFAKFVAKYPSFSLEIYGDGPEKRNIEQIIKMLSLENHVFLMGTSTNAIEKIADSYGFIMTSLYEGMPNALMEAMAIGLPCISSDCPFGPRELIDDGKNGLLFEVGNIEMCCDKMFFLVEHFDRAIEIGKEASKIIKTNNVKTISKQYYDFVINISHHRGLK